MYTSIDLKELNQKQNSMTNEFFHQRHTTVQFLLIILYKLLIFNDQVYKLYLSSLQ